MKKYYGFITNVFAWITANIIMLGFVLPYLISVDSTIAVILGWVCLLLTILGNLGWIVNLIKQAINVFFKNSES